MTGVFAAGEAGNRHRQGPLGLGEQPDKQEFVVGQKEREQGRGDDPGPDDRNDHLAKSGQTAGAVDHGRLFQLAGNFHEEAAQHPDGERLVDRHHGQDDQDARVQQVQGRANPVVGQHKGQTGQRTEAERGDQNDNTGHAGITRQGIAGQTANTDRDNDRADSYNDGVNEVIVEFGRIDQLGDGPKQGDETGSGNGINISVAKGNLLGKEQQTDQQNHSDEQEIDDRGPIFRHRTKPQLLIVFPGGGEEKLGRARIGIFERLERL